MLKMRKEVMLMTQKVMRLCSTMKLLTQIEKHVFDSIGFLAKMWINPLTTSIIQGKKKKYHSDMWPRCGGSKGSIALEYIICYHTSRKHRYGYGYRVRYVSEGNELPSPLTSHRHISPDPDFWTDSVQEFWTESVQKSGLNQEEHHLGLAWERKPPLESDNERKKRRCRAAVIESKSQLVGIRDRVRADTEVTTPAVTSAAAMNEEGKRLFSATNPDAKDAADLLRMCVQCGIPKTYSHARGVVCPVCGDCPLADTGKESEKKKGSTMKDKEKSKRLKGQSSHATWKSETEMHLRQQYD
ncbi:hypothetical protein KSP40_PGU016530 [Platanthera guangdongensis]|uniref:Uncharacterized protein n=1 Tax=Platanthera guangdongensis TaxID=2320717 RepID=A0ABR2N4N7_9ASPA